LADALFILKMAKKTAESLCQKGVAKGRAALVSFGRDGGAFTARWEEKPMTSFKHLLQKEISISGAWK